MDFNCSFLLGSDCSTGTDALQDPMAKNRSCDLSLSSGCVGMITDELERDAQNKPPLIDDDLKHILELYINVIGFIVTSSIGVIANVINIAVYWKQGLSNSITLGFFALSISDLILVAMPLFTGSLYAAKYVMRDSPIHFSSVHYVSFGWVRNFTYSCSLLITAFLSLERCCCIVLPFKVQTMFTRKRTAVFLFFMFLFHAACLGLLPAIVQLKWLPTPPSNQNNSKMLRVEFSDFGREIEVFYSTSMSFVVPVGCQIIVTLCAFVMVKGLRKASQFRAQATSAGNKLRIENEASCVSVNSHIDKGSEAQTIKNSDDAQTTSSTSTLSSRDARLVRTMIFLVCILSACNIPFLAATFAWRSIPDLNIGKPYENMLSVVFSIVYILGNLNAASNILVYYKTSARFRQVFKELFITKAEK